MQLIRRILRFTKTLQEKRKQHYKLLDELFARYDHRSFAWERLSVCVPRDYIIEHPDLPWFYDVVLENPSFDPDRLLDEKQRYVYNLSRNPNLTLEDLEDDLKEAWSWNNVSSNPHLTGEYIKAHLDRPWNWSLLTRNKAFSLAYIDAHPELPWDRTQLSLRSDVTLEYIETHPDDPWRPGWLMENPNLPLSFLQSFPREQQNWTCMSRNPRFSLEFIRDSPDLPWDRSRSERRDLRALWNGVTANPNLTLEYLLKHKDLPWNVAWLSLATLNPLLEEEKERQELIR
ncbi:MAG: hypothetical protein ACYCQJ_15435 [Nitrososphaerales archaeon]